MKDWWPIIEKSTERCCNQRLLPSVAMLVLGTFLGASYPLGLPPLGSGRVSRPRDVTTHVWRGHVLSSLATALLPDPGSRMSRVLSEHLKTISPRPSHINTGLLVPLTRLLMKEFSMARDA